MINASLNDLIAYTVFVIISFVLSAVYRWLTAKNDQFSYPAKLRGIVKLLPWVALSSYPALITNYLTHSIPYVAVTFFGLGLAVIAFVILAIIAALFHRQSRDRVTKPFENEHAQKVWGWFIAVFSVVATVIVFVAKAIINLLRAINWSNALTDSKPNVSKEKDSFDFEKNWWKGEDKYGNLD